MSSSNDVLVLVGGEGLDWASLSWDATAMPYMMVETAGGGIQFVLSDTPFDWGLTVLRLHVFGPGGDLMIRRDEDRVYWRFVGYKSTVDRLGLQGGPFSKPISSEEPTKALLWGKYDDEDDKAKRTERYEARMAKANMMYPNTTLDWKRVEIHAYPIVAEGEVVAYWTYELAAHDEVQTP